MRPQLLLGIALAVAAPSAPASVEAAEAADAVEAPAPLRVAGEASSLIVQAADLPPGFRQSGSGATPEGGAAALFLRPAALGAADASASRLMGVKAALHVHGDVGRAREWMRGETALTAAAVRRDLETAGSGGPAPVAVRELSALSPQVDEADEAVAYRVAYRVEPLELVDYRFRFRVADAVADLFVTVRAREDGSEPAAAAAAARDLARVQAGRLLDALR